MIDMKKNNQKGFSLIEILIAITVFAIGILAVDSYNCICHWNTCGGQNANCGHQR
jgi:prepilin-type N-terminal cleavage/methylation domain-containing protein